jgi:hypothetical protein
MLCAALTLCAAEALASCCVRLAAGQVGLWLQAAVTPPHENSQPQQLYRADVSRAAASSAAAGYRH